MPDVPDSISPQDRTLVNVTVDQEIHFWTAHLGVSEAALRQAVADVGVTAESVAQHLGKA